MVRHTGVRSKDRPHEDERISCERGEFCPRRESLNAFPKATMVQLFHPDLRLSSSKCLAAVPMSVEIAISSANHRGAGMSPVADPKTPRPPCAAAL